MRSAEDGGRGVNSSFCWFCRRDEMTGELFCARLGGWHDKCPFADGDARDGGDESEDET